MKKMSVFIVFVVAFLLGFICGYKKIKHNNNNN